MEYQLRFSGSHYEQLRQHLFPGDGKEAVAIVLCGRFTSSERSILLSHRLLLIPYDECDRNENYVHWKTEQMIPFLEEANKRNMGILKIHSHPGGYESFSDIDDRSDSQLFPSIFGWVEFDDVHGSAIMLPTGRIFGRVFDFEENCYPINKVMVAGDEIRIWERKAPTKVHEFAKRTIQSFGEGTYSLLRNLRVGVIGCSGTGSPTIEQLYRLGVGELVIVDPKELKLKNVNRIINSTIGQAENEVDKVDIFSQAIRKSGLPTRVISHRSNLYDSREAINDLICCDILFGCTDRVDSRYLTNQVSNFYNIPYLDMGVRLIADGSGSVEAVVGSVHYIQPGMSSLLSRGLISVERLRSEGMQRQNPEMYKSLLKEEYISGVNEERPAVISLNMMISSQAVTELLNRLHPFKDDEAHNYGRVMLDIAGGCIENTSESKFEVDKAAEKYAGFGDCTPFLRMTELQAHEAF